MQTPQISGRSSQPYMVADARRVPAACAKGCPARCRLPSPVVRGSRERGPAGSLRLRGYCPAQKLEPSHIRPAGGGPTAAWLRTGDCGFLLVAARLPVPLVVQARGSSASGACVETRLRPDDRIIRGRRTSPCLRRTATAERDASALATSSRLPKVQRERPRLAAAAIPCHGRTSGVPCWRAAWS